MEKVTLWGKEIEKDFMRESENLLDDFLELIRHIQKNNIQDKICESTWNKAVLWEWLCSKDQIELNDIKRELLRRMKRAICVNEEEYDENLKKLGKAHSVKVLVLSFKKENIYYISTTAEYYTGVRSYLAKEKKNDFGNDLQECFPNIYFSEGVGDTINTLNQKFEDIREEIVKHLTQMNDYHARFLELLEKHKSYREIAKKFSADTGIDCSPQSGREKTQALKEKYMNKISGQEETIVCELHTKFKTFNINRERQDRIYFFPGKQGIVDGRIVVKHIGTHL